MLYLQLICWSLIFPMLRHGSFAIWICTRWYLINIDADISRRINNSIKTNNTYCHRHVRKHQAILPSRSIPTTSKSSSVSHQYCWHSIMNLPKTKQNKTNQPTNSLLSIYHPTDLSTHWQNHVRTLSWGVCSCYTTLLYLSLI